MSPLTEEALCVHFEGFSSGVLWLVLVLSLSPPEGVERICSLFLLNCCPCSVDTMYDLGCAVLCVTVPGIHVFVIGSLTLTGCPCRSSGSSFPFFS